MGGHRHFSHLVEEDGSFVGYTEIAFALADGTGEGSFLMTKQFTVDGSFGNGAAVNGEILLATAGGIVVNDAGENLFSHAALSDDEYAEVSRCHLKGDIERAV